MCVRLLTVFFITVPLLNSYGDGLNILVVFPYPIPSHYILGEKLVKSLAVGHHVTTVSFYSMEVPLENVTEIILDADVKKYIGLTTKSLIEFGKSSFWTKLSFSSITASKMIGDVLETIKFQALLSTNLKFDLIILEIHLNELMIALAHHFKCPLIIFQSMATSIWTNHLVGNVAPFSYTSNLYGSFSSKMTFYERIMNLVYGLIQEIYFHYVHLPRQDKIMKKYFPGAPDLTEMMYNNVSMIFLNSHPSVTGVKPLVPALVEIGGFHIDDNPSLPSELENIVNNSKYGLIYVSLGTNIRSEHLPEAVLQSFIQTFSKMKATVLWKIDVKDLKLPENIVTRTWFPQNAILAHPNTKVFITHGGLLSITEAVHFGVPIISIPVFADQRMNARFAKESGFGLQLDLTEITEDIFTRTIQEIVQNSSYKKTVDEHSKFLRQRIVKPTNEIVFWTEFVAKNTGQHILRSPSMDMHWIQIYLIDIWTFLFIVILLIRFACLTIKNKICSMKTVNVLGSKKQN